MTPFEMIRTQMNGAVPFAAHVGIEIEQIGAGTARATLEQREAVSNHIGSLHAGAMFTLGEAASGAALAGALAEVILETRPVAAGAQIDYCKIAKGALTATAEVQARPEDLLATLRAAGKVAFEVAVDICDESQESVARMVVHWHVSMRR